MEFNSLFYVFAFLPAVFACYLAVHSWPRFANLLLIAASVFFYCYVIIWYSIPLFISALVDYFCGQRISQSTNQRVRKSLLVTSVIVNLSIMGFFKYTGWITGELAAVLASFGIGFSQINVSLPPGVSFYTFQTMSYTIDIYRGEFKAQRGFTSYFSFVSFFPQLVAGPIERARNLLPQLAREREIVSATVASSAIFMILFGLFQKVALADNFGGIVDVVFRNLKAGKGELAPGLGLVLAYAFALQIYCDFAAYSTIARGTARLFSIELSRNFLTPYFASNPSEFWTRWHITLSSWLRDYLYIPLGGNKQGKLVTLRNLAITMTLGGLWHGAGIFFIVWGLYHGFLLILYRLLPIDEILIRHFGRAGKVIATITFFHLVCIGWIFFRTTPDQFWPVVESIAALPEMMGGLLTNALWGVVVKNWTFTVMCWGLFIFGLPVCITDYLGWRNQCEFPDLFDGMHWLVRAIVIVALIYAIVFFGRREANEFIYFAF